MGRDVFSAACVSTSSVVLNEEAEEEGDGLKLIAIAPCSGWLS